MTINQARSLHVGDKVQQKKHGCVMTVERIEDSRLLFTTNEFVNVICRTETGEIMKHSHKELSLIE